MAEKKKKDESAGKADEAPPAEEEKKAEEPEVEPDVPGMRKLYRSTTNRMIAGICGGIGEFFNIDPTLVRILFAISVLFGGFGVLAYIVGWIVIPEGSPGEKGKINVPASNSGVLGLSIGAILVIIGLGMFFNRMRYWYFMPDWLYPIFSLQTFFALALIGAGVFFIFYMFRNGDSGKGIENPISGLTNGTLFRSTTDKKISGVCGGIGEHFKIDPTIIRVLWIVVSLSTGLVPGVIIYLILAVVIPERPLIKEDVS